MLCSIIPYTRSIDDGLVTYSLPDVYRPFVKIGSSVRIPWGKDEIIGLVATIAKDIPYEGELRDIIGPHCSVPWVSPSEISLIIHLARQLFVRIHVVAQLFLPQGIFALFEHANFLELSSPVNPEHHRVDSTYTIAPNNEILISHLRELLTKNPGAVIVPDGVSVKWWASACDLPAIVDTHPKSLTSQKKIYLELLHQAFPVVFGTRRTLLKRLGYYQHIYVVHENLTKHIALGLRQIPLWIMLEQLARAGHSIHYLTITPSIRTLTQFLQGKKTIHYL